METTAEDAAPTLLGRLLDDRYRLESLIARGGMATVYLATDTRLDRAVAVKVMHRALAEDPDFVARFTREAKASARVSAPEVVAVHDQGTDRETRLAYLVMEHVRGINLRQLLQERGALAPARAVSIIEPVLRALAAAHAAGLVHRDIKPENVLLADDGRVKVADFGLARAVESSNLTQTTGLLIGTVAYLAPEQVESGSADARTDVYAAGVLLWELLTGAPPYGGDSPLSVAYKHVHEDVPPPSSAVDGIPPALDDLVVRATRRDPDARPLDGGAFLADLLALPAGSVPPMAEHKTLVVPRVTPADKPATAPPARRRRRRRGLVWTTVGLLLAVLALGGGYYLGSYRYTTAPRVLDLPVAQAHDKLTAAGLKVKLGPEEFSESIEKGHVKKQSPDGNGRVRKGGTVTLTVSKGPDRRRVPQLLGQTVAVATQKLKNLGLSTSAAPALEYSDTVAKDTVIRTDPAAGAGLRPGAVVTLVVSRGPTPVKVQDVRGQKLSDAQKTLEHLGFKVDTTEVFSDTVEKGRVVDQSPWSGTADKGSSIALTVSKGPDVVDVPNVIGKKVKDATALLESYGLVVKVDSFGNGPKRVIDQTPRAGSTVKRGSTVRLVVY
jgi:beta-lactam-binding protein with PASTA domain/serine/threonine protein kinase